MALDMTPEQKEIGKGNFKRVVGKLADTDQPGVTRRRFMQGLVAAGATVPVSAAAYFGYREHGFPRDLWPSVKAGIIGTGDEGEAMSSSVSTIPTLSSSSPTPIFAPPTNGVSSRGKPRPARAAASTIITATTPAQTSAYTPITRNCSETTTSRWSSLRCRCISMRKSPSQRCKPASTSCARS